MRAALRCPRKEFHQPPSSLLIGSGSGEPFAARSLILRLSGGRVAGLKRGKGYIGLRAGLTDPVLDACCCSADDKCGGTFSSKRDHTCTIYVGDPLKR